MDCAKCNGCAEIGKHANSAQCAVFSTKIRACSTTDVQLLHSNKDLFLFAVLAKKKRS